MRKKQYDIKARNINTSLKTESETDETPTDSTSKYKIKSRKQETKEKFISVDYHGAHRLAKSSFQLYVVFTDQYYHLKLSNTMREMSSNISFDFHNDSKIIKDIISDSVLWGLKYLPRMQYAFIQNAFIQQDNLIEKSEVDLIQETFKRTFEVQEDIEAVIDKCNSLKSRDNTFFEAIMKAECLRGQYTDLFNSLLDWTKGQEERRVKKKVTTTSLEDASGTEGEQDEKPSLYELLKRAVLKKAMEQVTTEQAITDVMNLAKDGYWTMLIRFEKLVSKLYVNWCTMMEIWEVAGSLYNIGPQTFWLILDQTVHEIRENQEIVINSLSTDQ